MKSTRRQKILVWSAAALIPVAVALIPSATAFAATPPQVVSSSATPLPVNAGSTVTFTWQFTSQAGVSFATLFARGPNGSVLPNCGGSGDTLASGTANAGTYQQVCAVPTTAANGPWTTTIQMEDGAGNTVTPAGPSFTVTGGMPATPPQVVSSSATPSPVNAGSTVTFTWQFTSQAGVSFATLFARGPNGSVLPNCGGSGDTLASGTANAGTYQQVCAVPTTAANGPWTTTIQMEDGAGNTVTPAGPSFTVTGGMPATPPQVVSSSATPSPVNAGSTVTFTWQFTSQAGVSFATLFARGPNGSVLPNCGGSGDTLASGTANAGTYQQVCAVPTTAANGPWTTTIQMEDGAGNTVTPAGPSFTVGAETIASVSPTAATYGDPVTYQARVIAELGTPTGTVSFRVGNVPLCTTPSLSSGTASCVAKTAPGGLDRVTATYSGDTTFGPAVGNTTLAVFQGREYHYVEFEPVHCGIRAIGQLLRRGVESRRSALGFGDIHERGSPALHRRCRGRTSELHSLDRFAGKQPAHGNLLGEREHRRIRDDRGMTVRNGYWLVASDGGVFAFGDAGFYGSMGGHHLNEAIVGIASTPDGDGYWLVASDGGVFAFGDAGFYGSMGGHHLNEAIVGIASTPDGDGYWLVASDGGVFAFGDAGFYRSMGGHHLNEAIVGIASTPDGNGYWLVASDGGVFAFGDAEFYGSNVAQPRSDSFVGIASSGSGGYWLVSSNGSVFAHAERTNYGSIAPTLTVPGSRHFLVTERIGLFVDDIQRRPVRVRKYSVRRFVGGPTPQWVCGGHRLTLSSGAGLPIIFALRSGGCGSTDPNSVDQSRP